MASRPIDEKIVVMKLDNSDFTRKATETTGIFGKLREALNRIPSVNLGKTTQELSAINQQAANTNLNGLSDSLQTVASRFTNLGVVATTVLANIANRAVNAGMTLTKSLTIDQVLSGFQEYETKIGSIQTILANTQKYGTKLEDVNKSLSTLNDYADQTIYNFGDMTKNIGLFTNAGLKLEESTSMIKGFSNAAAASGTNAEAMAAAAYQLSQGLSSGYIITMDWMSLTNAGMGNDNMKRDLIALGRAMGTLDKAAGDDQAVISNWKEELTERKWLTTDVMSTYLQAMAGDMDKAALMAKGLTEAQADLLLQNAKTGSDAATKVRTFTQLMGSLKESIGSGWAQSFEIIFGDFNEATKLWSGLSNAIGGWFNKTSKSRNDLLQGLTDRGGINNIFEGIVNSLKPVGQIFTAIGDGFKKAFPPKNIVYITKLTETFKNFTKGLALNKETISKLTTIFQGVFSIFSSVWEITKRLGQAFLNLIPDNAGSGILSLLENVAKLAIAFNKSLKEGKGLSGVIDGLGSVLGVIGKVIGGVISVVGTLGSSLKQNIGKAIDWIKEKLAPIGGFFKESFGGLGGDDLLGAGAIAGIVMIVQKIAGVFDDFGDIAENVAETFEGVKDAVQNFAMGIKIGNLILIAIAIGILAGSLKTMEGIKTEDITKGITALAVALGVMIGGMMLIDKFNVTGGLRASITLIALATAVNIMASSLKKISDLNPDKLSQGIGGLFAITATLTVAIIAMSKWGGKIKTSSVSLIALAGAVYILASAVETMSDIDTGKLFISIGALALIFAELAIFLKVVDKSKLGVSSALGILITAAAIQVMVSAIDRIAGIDIAGLAKGLGTIAILLAEIVLFSKLAGGPSIILAGVGLSIIAVAMNALVRPIQKLGSMSLKELAKGLGAMVIALAAVTAAGLLASGAIGGALAITVMAVALNMLVIPIQKLGSMTWGQLLKGFIGLAAGMALLAGTSMLLTPAVPSMLAFGAGLLLLGAAVALAGAGVALFGMGLATLATLTATSIAAIVAALALLLKGVMDLIPAIVNFVVALGLALVQGLVALIPPLVEGIVTIIIALLKTISDHLPEFLKLGVDIVVKLIDGLASMLQPLVDAGLNLIVQFILSLAEGIRNNGQPMLDAIMQLLGEVIMLFVQAGIEVVNALFGWIPGVTEATAAIGKGAEKYIRDNFGAKQAGEDKGKEFANALDSKKGDAQTSGKNVGNSAKTGLLTTDILTVGNAKGTDFATGFGSKTGAANTSGINLANAGKNGVSSVSLTTSGTNFGLGFANGIESEGVMSKVVNAAKRLASAAKAKVQSFLDEHSPSKEMEKDGIYFGEGFANGIVKSISGVVNSAKVMAASAKTSLNNFLDGFEVPAGDDVLHFKAVVDYEALDVNKFGSVPPLYVRPDTSLTNGLITATKADLSQNGNKTSSTPKEKTETKEQNTKQPAVIQVVTPDKREIAKWVVDDVTEMQEFNLNRKNKF